MASTLHDYKGAAKDRETKLVRAVKSVLNQSFKDWELIIIADGCQKTVDIVNSTTNDSRVKCYKIDKQPLWSGVPRNLGKFKATGIYITYLDNDDYFGENHLQKIVLGGLSDQQWVWFNDWRWNALKKDWFENYCYVEKIGRCGTSNVCFQRSLEVAWPVVGNYQHDWEFMKSLRKYEGEGIATPEYYVCHIPQNTSVLPQDRAYDI